MQFPFFTPKDLYLAPGFIIGSFSARLPSFLPFFFSLFLSFFYCTADFISFSARFYCRLPFDFRSHRFSIQCSFSPINQSIGRSISQSINQNGGENGRGKVCVDAIGIRQDLIFYLALSLSLRLSLLSLTAFISRQLDTRKTELLPSNSYTIPFQRASESVDWRSTQ